MGHSHRRRIDGMNWWIRPRIEPLHCSLWGCSNWICPRIRPKFIQKLEKWFLWMNSHQIVCSFRVRINSSLVWIGLYIGDITTLQTRISRRKKAGWRFRAIVTEFASFDRHHNFLSLQNKSILNRRNSWSKEMRVTKANPEQQVNFASRCWTWSTSTTSPPQSCEKSKRNNWKKRDLLYVFCVRDTFYPSKFFCCHKRETRKSFAVWTMLQYIETEQNTGWWQALILYDTYWHSQEEAARLKDHLQQEKNELSELLDKKNQEIDHLREDLTEMSQKLKESNFAKISAQAKADEAMSDCNVAKVNRTDVFLGRARLRVESAL